MSTKLNLLLAGSLLGVAFLGLPGGCSSEEASPTPGHETTRNVFVVNYPLAYFAQRIGAEAVDVHFPVPEGIDPAYWRPDDESIEAYQRADLILLNGAAYAKWRSRVSLPLWKLIDTSAGFRDQYMLIEDAVTHQHGPEGDHSHGDVAFTTWLDPSRAIEQAESIRAAFALTWPDQAESFQSNFESLQSDLASIDAVFSRLTSAWSGRPILASHPVYQYFSHRYGLDLESLHWEPDVHPDADAWEVLHELRVDHPATIMFWEDEPHQETRLALTDLGIRCVVVKPCGNTPESGDYLSVMRANIKALEEALRMIDSPDD